MDRSTTTNLASGERAKVKLLADLLGSQLGQSVDESLDVGLDERDAHVLGNALQQVADAFGLPNEEHLGGLVGDEALDLCDGVFTERADFDVNREIGLEERKIKGEEPTHAKSTKKRYCRA